MEIIELNGKKYKLIEEENKETIKIIKADTIREGLKLVFAGGGRPATIKEIYELVREGKIKDDWYTTGTLYIDGEFRRITKEDLKNIDNIYENGGRLVVRSNHNYGLSGSINLDNDNAQFVRVASETQEEEK